MPTMCRRTYTAIVAVLLMLQWTKSADLPLPYQSPDLEHMQHMLDHDTVPIVPNRDLVKTQVDQLVSTYIPQSNWLPTDHGLGSVSAVAFDNAGNVIVFHRGDRRWNQDTFDASNNRYRGPRTPIGAATMVAFSRRTGTVAYRLGEDLFYMPHGLTVDAAGDIYATDVALHQVMKLRRQESGDKLQLLWALGEAFRPGSTNDTFCKPTGVAVLPNGEFFVADGYCNARIMKYSADARRMLLKWGRNSFSGPALATAPPNFFSIPHALTLAADRGWLCVADREHGRVQCFDTDGNFKRQYHSPLIGDRLFSVAYAPVQGGRLYVVNGPDMGLVHRTEVMGFVVDMDSGAVVSKFTPRTRQGNGSFTDPHDVIVSEDGIEVYVADLDDMAFKLISADPVLYNKSMDFPTYTRNHTDNATAGDVRRPRSTILLVATLTGILVSVLVMVGVLLVRRRQRGNSASHDSSPLQYRQLMSSTLSDSK